MKLIDYIKIKQKEAVEKNLEEEAIIRLLLDLEYNTKANLIFKYNDDIDTLKWDKILSKYLDDKIPVQYIAKHAYFYGRKYYVDENVLIPRPETELLCEYAINIIKTNKLNKIIDIGTGSGAIAVTLYNEVDNIDVVASDISKEALEIAQKNSNKNPNNNSRIKFIQSDVYDSLDIDKYDMIISNPPYIPNNDYVEEIVKNNEPHLALYGGEDGLDIYEKIIKNITDHLNENGWLLFEIGVNQGKDIEYLLNKYQIKYNNIKVHKDYNGLDRIVIVKIVK